jgi:membrane-associated phospholipid phosphatase
MNKKIQILTSLAMISFILLGFLVHYFPHSRLDIYISKELQEEVDEQRPIELSHPLTYVSILGNDVISVVCVLAVSLIFLVTHYARESVFTLFVFLADGLNLFLKMIINRPRPTPDIVHIAEKFNHSSFPSGHVVHYVVFLGFLLIVIFYKKIFTWPLRLPIILSLTLLILTIPFSRIYLGAHWASDVIGGYLMGFIFLSVMSGFYFKNQ